MMLKDLKANSNFVKVNNKKIIIHFYYFINQYFIQFPLKFLPHSHCRLNIINLACKLNENTNSEFITCLKNVNEGMIIISTVTFMF